MNDGAIRFDVPPLEKTVIVKCSPDRAFQAFTAEIGAWWPLATHSVSQDKARTCAIEPWVGGRVFETDTLGKDYVWGQVRRWSPPDIFAMTWHPGRDAASGQLVELSFLPNAEGTMVKLVHSGWEVLAEEASETRDRYDQGWGKVFGEDYHRYVVGNDQA